MKASLDTNVIIHLYQANMQGILFDVFSDDIYLYEQIRNVELEHHGQSVLKLVDADIEKQKIKLYTNDMLRAQGVYKIFENNVKENRFLYGTGDLGEVYAISLAQTLGVYSLVTDDTKLGGPYMSLMQLNYDVMPFNFVDILILRYLLGIADAYQTVKDFNVINEASEMNWAIRSKLARFIRRFIRDPYKTEEKELFKNWAMQNGINALTKLKALRDALRGAEMNKILVNKIKCNKCGEIIESTYRHDFKFCKCGAVAVDGGHDYLRRCGNREDWEELSEVSQV